ncbi:hypothetical protein [Pontibaca salina]|uniref:Phage tail protein n=1 Tax=Pontibaca salina TaxID=2795731 RepID=A0A934M492_9RHOB|nr:hypothetical protein [Pontibaca salina]MBI6630659.1 hypothetical protein [Pontibaca salina]
MSFSLEILPATAIADQNQAARRAAINAECRRRILALLDQTAQLNLAADAAAGRLHRADKAAYRASLAWRDAMRARAGELDADGQADFTADAAWPAPGAPVTELAARF